MSPRTWSCLRLGLRIVELEHLAQMRPKDTPCETCNARPGSPCRYTNGAPKSMCVLRRRRSRLAEISAIRVALAMKVKFVERIVAAAIKHENKIYSLPPPSRHHSVCKMMAEQGFGPETMRDQGFITDSGRYVSRSEGAIIATAAKQLMRKTFPTDLLFSEDVW